MTIDLATLAIEIDSTRAVDAAGNLDKLTAAGDRAQKATTDLGNASGAAGERVRTASQAAAEMADKAQRAALGTTELGRAYLATDRAVAAFANAQAQSSREVQAATAALKAGEISLEQYNAEVLRSKTALSLVQAEYNRTAGELRRLNAAQQMVTVSAGQQRAGMQQLSFQIGDVAQQFALGAGPMQIFAAQGTQVVQALSLMRGGASGLVGFLAGPWGAALLGAATVVGMLVSKLMDAEEATKDVEFASYKLRDAQSILGSVMDLTTGKINTQSAALIALARAQALAAKIEAQRLQASARAEMNDIRRGRLGLVPGGLYGLGPGRVVDNTAGIVSAFQEGSMSIDEAERALASLQKTGVATEEQYLRAIKAVTDFSLGVENEKVFGDLRKAIDGDAEAIARFTKVTGSSTGPTRAATQAVDEQAEARERQIKATDDYIKNLELEVQKIGLNEAQLRQLEISRAMEAAVTDEQRKAIERLNIAREEANSNLKREIELEAEAKRVKDLRAGRGADLDRELELIGLTGAARARAAVEQERRAQKAMAETQELKDAIDEIADKEIQLINYQEEADRIADLADLYEDLFTGGIDNVWDSFKRQGLAVISQIAAQWTLALLSGRGTGSFGAIANQALGQSPLGNLFGGLLGGTPFAANDNGIGALAGGQGIAGMTSGTFGAGVGRVSTAGASSGAQGGFSSLLNVGPVGGALQGLAINQVIGGITGKGSNTGAAIGGAIGSLIPIPGGQIIGAVLGSLIGGAVKSTPRGSAILNGSEVTGFYGNSSSRKGQASGLGGSITDAIAQIAEALGGTVNASAGRVSIGIRKDSINVDPQGRGYTKTSKFSDIRAFGQDQEAAIRFAISDLIADGVIEGISAASQKILRSGQDLEKAIEKAVLIESVPKLLRERMDPLGAALEAIDAKFKTLADALREGGASAEQFAQAEKLYNLERQDAIEQFGKASQSLKDFLSSLNAGSNSPLSLRQQRLEAERALDPFLEQINDAQAARDEVNRLKAAGATASQIASAEEAARIAAAGINQDGFQSAAQLLLDISRRSNASSGAFFSDFDRIRNLTSGAIGLIDAATPAPTPAQDLFSPQIVANTDYTNRLLENIRDLLIANDNSGGSADLREGGFIGSARQFA